MEKIVTFSHWPHAQPEFPAADLTDDNAQMLEIMMSDSVTVQAGHATAEGTIKPYSVTHPLIIDRVPRKLPNPEGEATRGLEWGIITLEAITYAVSGMKRSLRGSDQLEFQTKINFIEGLWKRNVVGELADYRDDFRHEMPNTTQVIEESSRFLVRTCGLADICRQYAVAGAGLERALALSFVGVRDNDWFAPKK